VMRSSGLLSSGTCSEVAGRQRQGPQPWPQRDACAALLWGAAVRGSDGFRGEGVGIRASAGSALGEGLWRLCPCSAAEMPDRELSNLALPSPSPPATKTHFWKPLWGCTWKRRCSPGPTATADAPKLWIWGPTPACLAPNVTARCSLQPGGDVGEAQLDAPEARLSASET